MFILKQLRRKKNISQTDLANAIGVSLRTIQLYEKKDANIPIKNLTKIAQYFDLSIAELYSYEVNEANSIYGTQKILSKRGNSIKSIGLGKYLVSVPLVSGNWEEEYAAKFDDKAFLEELARIGFVMEQVEDCLYMAFEITNNSMDNGSIEAIPNKAIVLGKLVPKKELYGLRTLNRHPNWIIVYKDSILCKQIKGYDKKDGTLICHSLNNSPEYSDFQISLSDIKQLFAIVKKQVD